MAILKRMINSNAYNFWSPNKLFTVIHFLMRNFFLLFLFNGFLATNLYGQIENFTLSGKITNEDNAPLPYANISAKNTSIGTVTNDNGKYSLSLPSGQEFTIVMSFVGYHDFQKIITGNAGDTIFLNATLTKETKSIDEVKVTAEREKSSNLVKIEMKDFDFIPNTSGNFETILKTMGVSSNNELSSQYSVRGGNFDENLVYVNDIEIYRPFLIRSGEQEGLSFVNSDLVSTVKFSAGGFDAVYGDKMSSVLDIRYKKPTEFGASVSGSLLGGSAHLEGISKNSKFTHVSGIRYKTNKYVLGALETQGEYQPNFTDVQSYITYQATKKLEVSFLGNYAQNTYNFIPENRSTTFGTYQQALNIRIFYDGQEVDKFETILGALSFNYRLNDNLPLKLIFSAFNTDERETYDIEGAYFINQLDNTIGSDAFGDSILNIGAGSYLNHARNYLDARVYSIEHKGSFYYGDNSFKWGAGFKYEQMADKLREWDLIDSAGYSIPYSSNDVYLFQTRKGQGEINSYRLSTYLQNTYKFPTVLNDILLTAGVRAGYWNYNDKYTISPRASVTFIPGKNVNRTFRLATGVYHQQPFYKELRDAEGNIYKDIKPQRSIHFIGGYDLNFTAWDRPFVFTTEVYYKMLDNLIPYKVDNVRIQYFPQYLAKGYATGIEFKINGEFVKDAQSWASLTLLKTEEDIIGDSYIDDEGNTIEPGYYSRPTDQLFNFSMFFQDYFPTNPEYKVHLNFVFASRRQVSQPHSERLDITYPISSYKRVDIGFSRAIKRADNPLLEGHWLSFVESAWITGEIFNLMDIQNKISYQWIRTVSNQSGITGYYAVPNFLTSRRLNLKLIIHF